MARKLLAKQESIFAASLLGKNTLTKTPRLMTLAGKVMAVLAVPNLSLADGMIGPGFCARRRRD
jgi:hypothetical protein